MDASLVGGIVVGQSVQFTASGGTGVYTWELSDGGVPETSLNSNPFYAHFDEPRDFATTAGYNIWVHSGTDEDICTIYVDPAPPHVDVQAGCVGGNYTVFGTAYNNDGTATPIQVDISDLVKGTTTVVLATNLLADDATPSGGPGGNHGFNFAGPVADAAPTTTHQVTAVAHGTSDVSDSKSFTCPKPPPKNAPAQLFFPEYLGERPPLY